jgi:two-component sensor histidine kinase
MNHEYPPPPDNSSVLYRISRAMIRLDTLSEKLNVIAESVAEALKADWVIIIRLDMQKRRILDSVTAGEQPSFSPPFDFEEQMRGLTGWAIHHRSTILSPKGSPDPRESERLQQQRKLHGVGSILVAPLFYAERTVGTITAVNDGNKPDFRESDLPLLENISNLAAAAMENARLYDGLTEELEQRRRTEHTLREREAELERALEEKELLLKEVHHRVKNNLAIIESMINLKAGELEEESARPVLEDILVRIDAIRVLHDKLYSGGGSSNATDAREYLTAILENASSFAKGDGSGAQLESSIEELELPVTAALYLGLMITELVTNAVKYAFPAGSSRNGGTPLISLTFALEDTPEGRRYRLTVADNGTGIPQEKLDESEGSLGIRLIYTLVEQLGGSAEVDTEEGTAWTVSVPAG